MGVRPGVVASIALVVLAAAAAASGNATTPTITLDPTSAMVNTKVIVHGTGFPPNTTYTISECGKTDWSLPAKPCTKKSKTVTTNDRGSFRKKIVAMLCPQESPPMLTEETCYVGMRVVTGVDTLALDPYAPLTVSWP